MMCARPARLLLSKAPVGRAYLGGWVVPAYPTRKQGRQSLPCLSSPWPEEVDGGPSGHFWRPGNPQRLSSPRKHPPIRNAQASCCSRVKVRLLATVRQVRGAAPFIATVLQTLYLSLLSTPVWEPGGGPCGMAQSEGPLPESLAWQSCLLASV